MTVHLLHPSLPLEGTIQLHDEPLEDGPVVGQVGEVKAGREQKDGGPLAVFLALVGWKIKGVYVSQ